MANGKGRKPKPTKLKVLTGNPGKRSIKKATDAESKLQMVKPDFPAHMFETFEGDVVKKTAKHWEYMVKTLHPLGLITKLDLAMLEQYIVTHAYWIQAIDEINTGDGFTSTTKEGVKTNPVFSAYVALHKMKVSTLVEFGMSPASRSKIQIAGSGEEVDPLDVFMNGQK